MSGIFLQKFPPGFRPAVLFVVFAGLLFSCGEGIRLFPFPFAEKTQNLSSELQNVEERDYERTFHRFENNQANFQSKAQRFNLPHDWTGVGRGFDRTAFLKIADWHKAGLLLCLQVFKSRFISAPSESRAPPVS